MASVLADNIINNHKPKIVEVIGNKQKTSCLWCSKELNVEPFCKFGGRLRIGKDITKSYCYHAFMVMFNWSVKNNVPMTPEDKFYKLHKPEIESWYESIPLKFTPDKLVQLNVGVEKVEK